VSSSFEDFYALFKRMLVHDEVLSARELLKIAPWDIREDPRLADLKLMVDVQLAHVDRPDEYWRMYEDYGIEKETIPLLWPILPEYSQFARFEAAMELVRPGMTVLDVGSYDGWFVNRAGLRGARAFGIDASRKMVDLANQVAHDHRTGARFAVARFGESFPDSFPGRYDLVVCMELYEHVVDTVSLLSRCAALTVHGGTLMVSTPHGSWLRGMAVDYGPSWDAPHPREHVRAPTPEDLGRDLFAAGARSVEVRSVPVGHPPVCEPIPGQASLIGIARF
jgi:2-polyprenyl-3-methyl-5-hydroxy-6-metoxy-1,4-benzoquinol methylase